MSARSGRDAQSDGPFTNALGCFFTLCLDDHWVLTAQIRLAAGKPVDIGLILAYLKDISQPRPHMSDLDLPRLSGEMSACTPET